jgi:hypothetical protein
MEMISGKRNIKRISCELKDDIEVEEDSKLVYYQIKSTTKESLPKNKIMDSIRLFCTINSSSQKPQSNEFVLVSNTKIANLKDILKR